MFVNQVNLLEFRGIKKCETPINLSGFTILIGRNNSGKSSVLEALSLLPLPIQHNIPALNMNRMDFIESLHSRFLSLLYKYSGKTNIQYLFNDIPLIISFDERKRVEIKYGDLQFYFGERDTLTKIASIFNATDEKMRENSNVLFIPNDNSFLQQIKMGLETESFKNAIIKSQIHYQIMNELINKCIDDNYTELIFAPGLQARKKPSKEAPYYVKIEDLGDGIEKITLISLWLESVNPNLVLWDDFETSFHPKLMREIILWLFKKNWQVVIATHSIDVLSCLVDVANEMISKTITEELKRHISGAPKLEPSDIKIIQLQKGEDDVLKHEELSIEDLENLFDANQDPRLLADLLKI